MEGVNIGTMEDRARSRRFVSVCFLQGSYACKRGVTLQGITYFVS